MDHKIVPSPINPDIRRFDRWAATYEQSFLQRWYFDPVHSKMLDLFARAGPNEPPSCMLDVGCGTDRLLRAASARWPMAQLLGVDPAPQMVAEARQLAPNASFEVASAEALPFPDQTADLVLSSLSFHHWADQQRGLQEIARVLRTGGWLCLADHTLRLAKLFGEKPKSREQLQALMSGAGLAIGQQQRLGLRFVLITLAQK
jgi:ubiquinone/menaquinone biosynthesis C-methylase UbiE